MGKYTQKLSDVKDSIQASMMSDEERLKYQLNKFRQGGVIGVPSINPAGLEMQEIAQRFVDDTVRGFLDPAFDCIQFQIEWADTSGLFADESQQNSALRYLKETGETGRYNALRSVIKELKAIFDSTGDAADKRYYLQSIDGLGGMNEQYRKVGVPVDIQLHCYEDVRWTLRSIAIQLENVFYDKVNQIEVLPKNLRRFSCYMSISDIRDLSDITGDNQNDDGDNTAFYADASNSGIDYETLGLMPKQSIVIACPSCYFGNFALIPDTVSNIEQTEVFATLPIQVRSYYYVALLPALQLFLSAVMPTAETEYQKPKFGATLWQAAKRYAKELATETLKKGLQAAKSYAMSMAYQALDDWGVVDFANGILKYTKPEMLMAQFGNEDAINSLFGIKGDAIKEMYNPDLGDIDSDTSSAKPMYSNNLGKIETTEVTDTQYKEPPLAD